MLVYENRPSKMKFFWCQRIFFVYYDFKNECKNEFEDNNEESCSWFKTKVLQKKSILEPMGLTSPTRQPGT